MELAHIITEFHHKIHQWNGDFVILSKEGGIKLLDGNSFRIIWEEKLDGRLLFGSLIHNNILYGSTIDTLLFSIDLDKREVVETGTRNIFFDPESYHEDLVLAKSVEHKGADKIKYLGLFNLRKSAFEFKKMMKTGRVFELLEDRIIHAGIMRDFELSCMNFSGQNIWTTNICVVTGDSGINRVKFIGGHEQNLVFAAESNPNSHFVILNKNSGEVVNWLSNEMVSLPVLSNYHSFIRNSSAYTLAGSRVISLNLITNEILHIEVERLKVFFYILEGERVFYSNDNPNEIGEYSLESNRIKWQEVLELGDCVKVLAFRFINNFLFVIDSNDRLIVLK
jgi:hypothetical protein